MPTSKELLTNMQLTMYALAGTKVHDPVFQKNADDILLSLEYLETEKKLSTIRTKEQLEEAVTMFFEKVEEMENSDFECSRGMLCENCEFKMLCNTKT